MPSVDNSHEESQYVSTPFTWSQWGEHVCIAGSFDPPTPTWTPIDMPKNSDGVHEAILKLLPNKKYYYKFVIDGNWVLDPTLDSYPDDQGNFNHEICVDPVPDEKSYEKPVAEDPPRNEEEVPDVPKVVVEEIHLNDEKVGESNVTDENDELTNEPLDKREPTEIVISPEIEEPSPDPIIYDDVSKETINEPVSTEYVAIDNSPAPIVDDGVSKDEPVSGENVATEIPQAPIVDDDVSKDEPVSAKNVAIENLQYIESQNTSKPIKMKINPVDIDEDVEEINISHNSTLEQERKVGTDDKKSPNIPPQGTVQIEDSKISKTSTVDPAELDMFNNLTWAKDDLSDDDVDASSSWLEPPMADYVDPPSTWDLNKSESVVWAEDSPDSNIEWPDIVHAKQEQLASSWRDELLKKSEEHANDEGIQSREETASEQIKHSNEALLNEIPSSTNINEKSPVNRTFEENSEKKKVLEFKESVVERDHDVLKNKLVIKENITYEDVNTTFEKPESSATASMKISSIPTVVTAAPVIVDNTMSQDKQLDDYLDQGIEEENRSREQHDFVISKTIEVLKNLEQEPQSISNAPGAKISQRKIISFSPNSSPGESTRNVDTCIQNIATLSSRGISTQTKETTIIKSKSKKPKEMTTSREISQKDPILAVQRNDIVDSGGGIIYLVTSLATTFTLGIISMLFKAVFGKKKNK
ncbi:14068_t:CDS:2 [Funneliformis mosseae]|uniref:14068_t:CDS:1 n=1 Tax=Funneliformis mosseae TaxID=27381 RepID=A0A9N9EB63_FUNMO|nr:14068_t:CDS:2 [Funneliformis mosseae]